MEVMVCFFNSAAVLKRGPQVVLMDDWHISEYQEFSAGIPNVSQDGTYLLKWQNGKFRSAKMKSNAQSSEIYGYGFKAQPTNLGLQLGNSKLR